MKKKQVVLAFLIVVSLTITPFMALAFWLAAAFVWQVVDWARRAKQSLKRAG